LDAITVAVHRVFHSTIHIIIGGRLVLRNDITS
jgi:hypothetical protein